jgi:hypothetical protein
MTEKEQVSGMLNFDTEKTPLITREGFISSWPDWLTD